MIEDIKKLEKLLVRLMYEEKKIETVKSEIRDILDSSNDHRQYIGNILGHSLPDKIRSNVELSNVDLENYRNNEFSQIIRRFFTVEYTYLREKKDYKSKPSTIKKLFKDRMKSYIKFSKINSKIAEGYSSYIQLAAGNIDRVFYHGKRERGELEQYFRHIQDVETHVKNPDSTPKHLCLEKLKEFIQKLK